MPGSSKIMTIDFDEWTESSQFNENGYSLTILEIDDDQEAIDQLSSAVPGHFTSKYSTVLERLGKTAAARFLEQKLPTSVSIKSGDLGEIIATEYIDAETDFEVPIKRLRWKDHRNMSMRGDDAIGVYFPATDDEYIAFLKVESKSRKSLANTPVQNARKALDSNGGLPSPHSLLFVAERLYEANEDDKADQIVLFQQNEDIDNEQVEHMLFTFSGNDPESYLKKDQSDYDDSYFQNTVGVFSGSHSQIILDVFVLAGDVE